MTRSAPASSSAAASAWRADAAGCLQQRGYGGLRDDADELGADTPGARAVEVDEVDAVCAGVGEASRECDRLARALDDVVVVALVQTHGALAEHVHRRDHLDRLCEPHRELGVWNHGAMLTC